MDNGIRQELIEYLRNFATSERWESINRAISNRTDQITIVLEDLHKPHNANAVLRSCDCFGIQNVHIIENKTEFGSDRQVTMGSDQWLNINTYNDKNADNIEICFNSLKKQGYKIFATSPHASDQHLNDVDITEKIALVFGTERHGISNRVKELADGFVTIPMHGFSESFNISVSAAICLYDLRTRLEKSDIEWKYDKDKQDELRFDWLCKTIKASDSLIAKYLREREEVKTNT